MIWHVHALYVMMLGDQAAETQEQRVAKLHSKRSTQSVKLTWLSQPS